MRVGGSLLLVVVINRRERKKKEERKLCIVHYEHTRNANTTRINVVGRQHAR